MKKYILLALIGALILPAVSRAESGSDSVRDPLTPANKLQRADYVETIKVKLEDGKLMSEREMGRVEATKIFRLGQRPAMVEQFRAFKQDSADAGSKIKHYMNTVTPRFGGLIEKLEKLTARIESHLAKLVEQGVDVSRVEGQLKSAINAIANAKAAVATLPQQSGSLTENSFTNATDGQTIRAAVQKVLTALKAANAETQALMKLVRELSQENKAQMR